VVGCSTGVSTGIGHTISGTVVGCTNGVSGGSDQTISGTVVGCSIGVSNATGYTISGTVAGCTYGVSTGTGHTISGTVAGCTYGVNGGTGYTISGTVGGCTYAFRFDRDQRLSVVCRAAHVGDPPTFNGRNTTGYDPFARVACEDYLGVLGAQWTFYNFGDVIKDTGTLRPTSLAPSSIKAVPQSLCSTTYRNFLPIAEWTEFDVSASAQTKSIYVLGTGWVVFPLATELYLEAEYYSAGSGCAKTVIASTQVLVDNTTWTQLSVTFTPGQVGLVRYRAYLKKYAASAWVNVDNALY
jgi:hypothetical protein